MPASTVRATTTFQAVSLSDSDWKDVLVGWLEDMGAPPEHVEEQLAQAEDNLTHLPFKPWLVKTESGVVPVDPANFAAGFEDLHPNSAFDAIWLERQRQIGLGYTPQHDDSSTSAHLVNLAVFKAGPLANPTNTLPDVTKREELVQAGALIVAAIEKIDRVKDVRTFSVD